MNVDILNNVRR